MAGRMGVAQLLSTELARGVNRVTLEMRIGQPGPDLMRLLHTLLVNPGDISESISSKSQTIETAGGFYTEAWGRGAGTLSIQGITGFRKRIIAENGIVLDGYQEYKRLRKFVEDYLTIQTNNRIPTNPVTPLELRIHFWEDDEHLIVSIEGPEAFKKLRSDSRPLLYGYSISFKVLGPVKGKIEADAYKQAAGYQRAQGALQSLSDAGLEVNRWLAVNSVGAQVAAKPMYDLAVSVYEGILKTQAAAEDFIRGKTAVLDLRADAFTLVNTGKDLIFDAIQGTVVDEVALGIVRPVRRVVCAARHLFGSIDEANVRALGAVRDIEEAFASATGGGGC